MQTDAWGEEKCNRVDPGAWERGGVSPTTTHGVCELLLLVECYFFAMGLSQRWYVKAQSAVAVTYVCADSLIQHQFVFRTWVR